MKLWQANYFISFILLFAYNYPFWSEINKIIPPQSVSNLQLIASIFVILFLIINLLLTILCWKHSYKFVYALLFLISSSALYFTNQYNVLIDSNMVHSIFESNLFEAFELINFKLLLYVICLGLLPLLFVYKYPLTCNTFGQSFKTKSKICIFSISVVCLLVYLNYPSYASITRNQRQISHKIIPTNYVFATISYIKQQYENKNIEFKNISKEAKLETFWGKQHNKTVTILILGETARADHFNINGYSRNTTPNLTQRLNKGNIVNFNDVISCGTSTAISLPCIYSHQNRVDFSKTTSKSFDNLLDFLSAVGFSVQWRDNNTGCKGVCDRTDFINLTNEKIKGLCSDGECYDEILLTNLSQQILDNPNNQVIILHQKGSHGPAYYLRYPEQFNKFIPVCHSSELQSCSQQEIINSYDNTIIYTDVFINKTINLLENLPESVNTSLIYISDHGESLGENNVYLHGMPYFIAPIAQKHIPMIFWLSSSFQKTFNINYTCLKSLSNNAFSHDNYFHSILGMLNIGTPYYNKQLDIFTKCKNVK